MKKAKTVTLILLLSMMSLNLSGCLHSVQLNERALVQAIGIDLKDDKIALTLQIFSPAASGSGISEVSENAKIIRAEGSTVSEAIENTSRAQGKQVFIGHNRIIVIGKELAESGIYPTLSYFSSGASARHNTKLFAAESTAEEIVTAKINQGIIAAESLEKMADNASKNGLICDIRLYDFLMRLENKNASAVMPIIKVEKKNSAVAASAQSGKGESEKQSGENNSLDEISKIRASGTAVFAEDRLVGELNDDESRGLLWLQNRVDKTAVNIKNDEYASAAAHIYKSKSRLSFDGENTFSLNVNSLGTIGEIVRADGGEVSYDDIKRLEPVAAAVIEKECRAAFEKAVTEYNADVFNFGDIIWKQNPDLWKTIHNKFPEVLKKIKLNVSASVKFERTGLDLPR